MNWVRLKQVYGERFRSLHHPFKVNLPDSGLTLISGFNQDTLDSSGSGKSSLVLAISSITGGCPFPGTELQSWHGEEPALSGVLLESPEGTFKVERCKGLVVTPPGAKAIRGKAADAELDKIFGMNAWLRALTTYRGQGQDGLFLSMSDGDKKTFFSQALDLDAYEKVAVTAAEHAKTLAAKAQAARAKVDALQSSVESSSAALEEARAAAGTADIYELKEQFNAVQAALESVNRRIEVYQQEASAHSSASETGLKAAIKELQDAHRAETESLAKEPPEAEELTQARAALETVRGRIEKVDAHDAAKRAERHSAVRALEQKIQRCRSAKQLLPRLEKELEQLKHQQTHLSGQVCPTCRQDWITDDAGKELERVQEHIAKTVSEIEVQHKELAAGAEFEKQLAELPEVEPHPFGPQLREKAEELDAVIFHHQGEARAAAGVRMKKVRAAQEELQRKTSDLMARAKAELDLVLEGISSARSVLQTEHAGLQRQRQQLRDDIVRIDTSADIIKTCETNHNNAVRALAEAQETLREAESSWHAELDLQAMLGREGFLGVIFEDVLAEAAAATNEVLSRVANVRHISFAFQTEKETGSGSLQRRIIPAVTVCGRTVEFKSGISGGQQSAVKLAIDLGVGEVIAKRRGSYPGWLVLDEAFQGLGRKAMESCLEMLQAYAGDRLVLVIDHSTEFKSLFQQTIKVVSRGDMSTIEQ